MLNKTKLLEDILAGKWDNYYKKIMWEEDWIEWKPSLYRIVKEVLETKDINRMVVISEEYDYRKTLLSYALIWGPIELLDFCLENKADPNLKDIKDYNNNLSSFLWNPLFYQLEKKGKAYEYTEKLLKAWIIPTYNFVFEPEGQTIIKLIEKYKETAIITMMNELKNGKYKAYYSTMYGNEGYKDIKEYLDVFVDSILETKDLSITIELNKKENINKNILDFAIVYWPISLVDWLLQYNIQFNEDNKQNILFNTFLWKFGADKEESIEVAEKLLRYGLNPNRSTNVLNLDLNKDQIKLLLKYELDINIQDSFGNTLLHYSVMKNDRETVKFLLKNWAKVDIENKEGKTAFKMTKTPQVFRGIMLEMANEWFIF